MIRKRTRTHDGKLNFSPSVWGEKAWDFIHIVAISYPNLPTFTDKNNYKNFFYSLGPVLPCERCTQNYENHLSTYPIDEYLSTPEDLFYWTVLIRNLVKRQTIAERGGNVNDKSHYYDAKKLKKHYCDQEKSILSGFKPTNYKNLDKIVIFVLGGILIFYVLFSLNSDRSYK